MRIARQIRERTRISEGVFISVFRAGLVRQAGGSRAKLFMALRAGAFPQLFGLQRVKKPLRNFLTFPYVYGINLPVVQNIQTRNAEAQTSMGTAGTHKLRKSDGKHREPCKCRMPNAECGKDELGTQELRKGALKMAGSGFHDFLIDPLEARRAATRSLKEGRRWNAECRMKKARIRLWLSGWGSQRGDFGTCSGRGSYQMYHCDTFDRSLPWRRLWKLKGATRPATADVVGREGVGWRALRAATAPGDFQFGQESCHSRHFAPLISYVTSVGKIARLALEGSIKMKQGNLIVQKARPIEAPPLISDVSSRFRSGCGRGRPRSGPRQCRASRRLAFGPELVEYGPTHKEPCQPKLVFPWLPPVYG